MDDRIKKDMIKTALLLHEGGMQRREIIEATKILHRFSGDERIFSSSLDMVDSLYSSCDKAGGSCWPIEKLLEMTLLDLFCSLATNNVRFVYNGPKDK